MSEIFSVDCNQNSWFELQVSVADISTFLVITLTSAIYGYPYNQDVPPTLIF